MSSRLGRSGASLRSDAAPRRDTGDSGDRERERVRSRCGSRPRPRPSDRRPLLSPDIAPIRRATSERRKFAPETETPARRERLLPAERGSRLAPAHSDASGGRPAAGAARGAPEASRGPAPGPPLPTHWLPGGPLPPPRGPWSLASLGPGPTPQGLRLPGCLWLPGAPPSHGLATSGRAVHVCSRRLRRLSRTSAGLGDQRRGPATLVSLSSHWAHQMGFTCSWQSRCL